MEKIALNVAGMTCGPCVQTVRKSLEKVEGVVSAEVTLSPPRAEVAYDSARVTVERLLRATGEEGYPATVMDR